MVNKHLAVIGVLIVALVVSWGWFYQAQKRTDAQLAMLMSRASPGAISRIGRPVTDPYLKEAVRNTLRKHTAEIQRLWVAYLAKQPVRTEGVIEADWQIDAAGGVTDAGVIHSDFEDKELADGVIGVLRQIRYPLPPSGARTYVSHKFKLKKE
jgi:hypothetical protein